MSNQRRHRRRPRPAPTIPRPIVVEVVRASCAARGCTCDPDIELRHDDLGTQATIRHDSWCPANPETTT